MKSKEQLRAEFVSELEAAIPSPAKANQRFSSDPEWSEKKDNWTTKKHIVGAFAMWSCRQSPYGVPDGLENVCKYLNASLDSCAKWDLNGMAEVSLCEINQWLYDILYNQGVKEFDAWNERKNKREGIGFCSATHNPTPDDDFIDLDALLRNVCIAIRDERRAFRAFSAEFDKKYGNTPTVEICQQPPVA